VPGRDNGLAAASYTPLADLDPQLADHMLDALRTEGVAAFALPAPGQSGPYLEVRLPDRPTDRLWVDRSSAARARTVLDALLPQLIAELDRHGRRPTAEAPPSEDEVWQAIVAGYDAPPTDPVPRWPAQEDVDTDPSPSGRSPSPSADAEPPVAPLPAPEPRPRPRAPGRPPGQAEPRAEPEEHYVPPPPPPLPTSDPVTRLAWLGVLGAPAAVFLAALAQWSITGWPALLLAVAFIASFVALVLRMPERRGDGDGPDDGAVV